MKNLKSRINIKDLKDIVKEVLGINDQIRLDASPKINVNNIVDPQKVETTPLNPNFTPQNKVEFESSIKNLIKNLPDTSMSNLYNSFKNNIDDLDKKEEKDLQMKNKDTQAEAIVRRHVRKMISESSPFKLSDAELKALEDVDDDKQSQDEEQEHKEGTFADIAQQMGFSVAGAKQAVDKALLKAQFLAQMDEGDLEIMTLTAMKDYISHLKSSGELTDDDVALMKDHPEIVRGLDGFREFLHKYVKREMRKAGKQQQSDD